MKKANIQMTTNTIVVLVLAICFLILGLVLTANIFSEYVCLGSWCPFK